MKSDILLLSISVFMALLLVTQIIIPAVSSSPDELRIMTFNLLIPYGKIDNIIYPWEDRIEVAVSIIKQYNPDFIGVQEAQKNQLDYILNSLPKYSFIGQGNKGDTKGEYGAILYDKDRFALIEDGIIWLSETPNKPSVSWNSNSPRIIVWGLFLDKASKQEIMIANTHFEGNSGDSFTAREESVKLFLDKIWPKMKKERYYAFIGDFNMRNGALHLDSTSKWQVQSRYLWNVLTGKALLGCEKATLVDAWDIASKKVNSRSTIDWILLSDKFDVEEVINLEGYRENGIPATDHSPVLAIVKYR